MPITYQLHFLQLLTAQVHTTNDFTKIDFEKTVAQNNQNQEYRRITQSGDSFLQ